MTVTAASARPLLPVCSAGASARGGVSEVSASVSIWPPSWGRKFSVVPPARYPLTAALGLIAAVLNGVFGLCLGCEMYLMIRRTTA